MLTLKEILEVEKFEYGLWSPKKRHPILKNNSSSKKVAKILWKDWSIHFEIVGKEDDN
jgi:hypothetical protein